MLPASLYTPLYHHSMLLVVIGCALLYWGGQGPARSLAQFNRTAMVVIGVGVILFMGFRPVSEAFVDMVDYAMDYSKVQQGGEGRFDDKLFNDLMRLCGPVLPEAGFFFVCALIYVLPIAVALWRVHGAWAFPVFLACLTAFSFWVYGVNGIRNGMATSVLLLAFAFHDKPLVMLALMAAAWGFHGAALLPAGAFLIVRYVKRTEIWLGFWILCVALTIIAGNVGEMLLSRYNPFAWDDRVDRYILNSAGSGFRADFLTYSILPVLLTLLLAAPTRSGTRRLVRRLVSGSALRRRSNRNVSGARQMEIGGQLCFQGVIPGTGVAFASFGRATHPPSNDLSRRNLMQADLSRRSLTKADQLPVLRSSSKGGSTRGRTSASGGRKLAVPGAGVNQNGWGQLPWVRLLRSDPFYARLMNTYLLTNALWILVIHAYFSNRFAYLSWFMMPWVLLYPFVPGKVIHRPRTGVIAAILFAHYLFTYLMTFVVYPLRGGGLL